MLNVITYTRDTRIHDVDYLLEDESVFLSILPYLKKKIQGEWHIALLLVSIKFVRRLLDEDIVPKYVTVDIYLDRSVSEQLIMERPGLAVKVKSAYEKYLDLVADLKVLIDPKAAKELYHRVGTHKDKLPDYLVQLSEEAHTGVITENMIRSHVIDERRTYASEVVTDFLLRKRWRWKKYNDLVEELGDEYAFYSMRKYINRLLKDKSKYLRNQETEIRDIDKIDSFSINQAYVLFNITTPKELCICMYMLENREAMRRIL